MEKERKKGKRMIKRWRTEKKGGGNIRKKKKRSIRITEKR